MMYIQDLTLDCYLSWRCSRDLFYQTISYGIEGT
jgi:hypothetical protein